jgi:hypothetical protein
MLDMSSKVNRDLGIRRYRIGLITVAREVVLVAALALRLDLRGSDEYYIAKLVSYHDFEISLTS